MSDATTRIVDLPENISMQMPAAISTQNGRMEYDPKNPTYMPINVHPNPYGNTIQPNVMPLPQSQPPAHPQIPYQIQSPVTPPPPATISSPEIIAELQNMPQIRLPSRDIPMDPAQYQQDEEIQPNYIPKPKLTSDYVREYEEAAEKNAKKQERVKKQAEQIEDSMTEFQLPIIVALLFMFFQLPLINKMLYTYLSSLPIFHTDGNPNFYGILLKSTMFGVAFWAIQRFVFVVA